MMHSRLRRFYALAVTIGLAALLLSLSLIVPVTGTTTDFSMFNTDWNGTSDIAVRTYKAGALVPSLELRELGTDAQPVIVPIDRAGLDPSTAAIVIIGPSKTFTAAEGAYVRDFLERGGVVVLADDFGTGNSLLANLNTTSRFTNDLVVDLAFEKKPEFAVAFDIVQGSPLTKNVSMLLLNYPSAITPSPDAETLARTSAASWVDLDGDQFKDPGEQAGPFTLLTVERIGGGTLVLLSDPSIMINGMAGQLDDSVLVEDLLAFAAEGRTEVFIDESHRNYFDPISFSSTLTGSIGQQAKLALVTVVIVAFFLATTDVLQRAYGLVTRTAHGLWGRIVRLLSKEEPGAEHRLMSDDEILGKVLERHPGWSRGALTRILRQVDRHGGAKR